MSNGTFFTFSWFLFPTQHRYLASKLRKYCLMCTNVHGDQNIFLYLSLCLYVCYKYPWLSMKFDYKHPLEGFALVLLITFFYFILLSIFTRFLFFWIGLCRHHISPVSISMSFCYSVHSQSCLTADTNLRIFWMKIKP